MELALGPLLFNWSAERIERFYAEIADEPVFDRVYLGEVVCSKRMPFLEPALVRSADRLANAGKTVVWSTLALPATEREQKLTRDLADFDGEIEINDMSAVYARSGRAFTAGPYLNIYNEAALAEMESCGWVRRCPKIARSLDANSRRPRASAPRGSARPGRPRSLSSWPRGGRGLPPRARVDVGARLHDPVRPLRRRGG